MIVNILISVASRYGSTNEIAAVIGQELRGAGHTVDIYSPDDVRSLEPYDAMIVGSAVYAGNWLPVARDFVHQHRARLAQVPVWLFSSGPLGDDPQPKGDPDQIPELMAAIGAREHTVFVGKLDKGNLGLGERLVSRIVGAPEGDFRDWDAIRNWARSIALALKQHAAPSV
jgi:menaquinone-dependent protoporphyrinogen oxidase